MKNVVVSIFSVFGVTCAVVASPSNSMLSAAQFPKNADDLTFSQRMDLLTDGYEAFDTVFDSNGVCIKNCPYVGMTIQEFNNRMDAAAQQVQQDLAELDLQNPIQGTVAPSEVENVDAHITNYLANYVKSQTGVDITGNAAAMERLNDIATDVRTGLANNETVNVDFNWLSQVVPNTNLSSVRLNSANFDADVQRFISLAQENSDIKSLLQINNNKNGESSPTQALQTWFRNRGKNNISGSNSPSLSTPPSSAFGVPTSCPLRVNPVRVSSEMGWRAKYRRNHNGIDLSVPTGTPIYAAADGRVVIRKNNPDGYGYYLSIQHDKGYYTVYGHLSKWLVSDGQTVRAGQEIAKSGNTGRSTGAHLHFEVLKGAPLVKDLGGVPVNPRTITNCTWNPKNNGSNTGNNRR